MQTVLFTGPVATTAVAAAATAATAAAGGSRVLLASIGPSHPVATLVGLTPPAEPATLAAGLDLWCLDPLTEMSAVWQKLWGSNPPITGEELPLLPGSDLFLAIARLHQLQPAYDLICIDGGTPETLLRALGFPDTFRWLVRLLLGLDRGPGRSSASLARSIIPTSLLPVPTPWLTNIQEARVQIEHLRDELTNPAYTQVRYVLSPEPASLVDAQVQVPALQLFGLAVEALVAGPLLPAGPGLEALVVAQTDVVARAAAIFQRYPLYRLAASVSPNSVAALATLGTRLYAGASVLPGAAPSPPVDLGGLPEPHVTLDLPGLPREALGLTLSGDELIVKAGPYRRHLLLPEGLRGITAIRASRQGDKLIIRPRQ